MKLSFSTKARTLATLKPLIQTAHIAPIHSFTVGDWHENRQTCLDALEKRSGNEAWIVRSSCSREDGVQFSNAGAFLSIPNVHSDYLETAVEKVIESYGELDPSDEVLIQPMLTQVLRSGVAFSHDPNTNAPYRVINWSEGDNTAAVTGGISGSVWQQAAGSKLPITPKFKTIIALISELLNLFDNVPLDCEFAVTKWKQSEILWLLQVRPLIMTQWPESDAIQAERLEKISKKISRGMEPHPFLIGRSTVFGVMPDWNPAEIVGIRPKPLALSLYRELVTDSIWAYQRHNYGYRNLRSFPLMPHFFGLPYIDVRLSFNSFIPADLDEGLAGRLVDHYIDRLLKEPTLHDKVEFEIVFSCYTLDLPQRLERLSDAGFSKQEFKTISDSLRNLTNRILHSKDGLWLQDASKIDTLNLRRDHLLSSSADQLGRIYWLLEDAKRYGTLPFAGLARAGFIAVQMLKSLVEVGVFSQTEYDNFMGGLTTVSGQFTRDRALLDKTSFLARYGHLRPGTYDILSPRYDEASDLYIDWDKEQFEPKKVKPFALTLLQMSEIAKLLELHGLQPDAVGLLNFIQAGIEQRELAKFHFTRNLSDALALITEFGVGYGFDREDLAFCDVSVFKELYTAAVDAEDLLRRSIEQGKARYEATLKVSLPPLISTPDDVWAFEWPKATPNFITQKHAFGPVQLCDDREKLAGAIVCIENADPGFDWLFSYPIAGLVTAWGGVNSHMAIRAGELGLPAVIGAGEVLFRLWSKAERLHIDCAGRRVEVLG